MDNKDFIVFPGDKFPFEQQLLTQGNFYLNTNTNNLVSKNLFKISTDSENNTQNLIVEGNYYKPSVGDVVLGTIISKSAEVYKIDIKSYAYGLLGASDFEGATKKTKPNLKIGDLIFTRVLKINKFDVPLLTCLSEVSKNWASGEAFFGPVLSGHIFNVPLKHISIFLSCSEGLIKRISDGVDFEHTFGMNGLIWINASEVKSILKIKKIMLAWIDIVYNDLFQKGLSKLEKESINSLPNEIERIINIEFVDMVKNK